MSLFQWFRVPGLRNHRGSLNRPEPTTPSPPLMPPALEAARGQAEVLAEVVDEPVLRVGGGKFGRRKTSVDPDPKLRTTRSLAAGMSSGGRPRPPPKEYYEQVLSCLEIPTVLTPNYGDDLNMSHFFLQYDLDKLEKGSVEWNKAMIRMLLHLKKDGHKIKEYVSGSGKEVSAAEYK